MRSTTGDYQPTWWLRPRSYSFTLHPINHLLSATGTPRPVPPYGRLSTPCSLQRTYSAAVWRSWGLPLPGTGSAACSRRSDQSAYPSQARANPTGTATSALCSCGSSAPAGVNTAATASRPAAQRERMPARNVAMPNSRPPSINSTPDSGHRAARTPKFISPAFPVKIPKLGFSH